ncbi:MAG: glycosyltransferase [Methanobacteriota archaeon]|nr:MAG: glycosyltransferase [Euryarchaeota archaeon]
MTHLPDRMEGSLPASDGECEEAGDFAANSMFDSGGEAFRITGPAEETDGLGEIAAPVGGTADSRAPGTSSLSRERPNPSGRRRAQVVVLLPALNEGPAIGAVMDRIPVDRMRTRGYDVRVWVVDGQSTDATMDIARARGASTFVQSGTGKGNGVRQALAEILANPTRPLSWGDRYFVMLDADGTYPADAIPRFVEALESGEEVVLGSRLCGSIADGAISDLNRLGNRLLSALASLLYRVPVTDVCTGMWAFREDALQRFGLVAEGFDLEADLFASACERGIRMRELPIAYDRRIGEPKLVPLRTGLSIAWRLLMRRLNRPSTELRRIPPAAARREETA